MCPAAGTTTLRRPRARDGGDPQRDQPVRPAAGLRRRSWSSAYAARVALAALSKYPTIFVWTHDSIGIGEVGERWLAYLDGGYNIIGDAPGTNFNNQWWYDIGGRVRRHRPSPQASFMRSTAHWSIL